MKRSLTIFFTFMMLAIGSSVMMGDNSKNNVYGIDSICYKYLNAGLVHRYDKAVFMYYEKMKQAAIDAKDNKAYVISYWLPLYYYSKYGSVEESSSVADSLRIVAKKYGYSRYYFQSYSQEINNLLNYELYSKAMSVVEKCRAEAFASDDKYGIYTAYLSMATIYQMQKMKTWARRYNLMALEYMEKYLPEQEPAVLYVNLFDLSDNTDEKKLYLEKAESTVKTPSLKSRILSRRLIYHGLTNKRDEFFADYAKIKFDSLRFSGTYDTQVKAYYYMFCNDSVKAYTTANGISTYEDNQLLISQIALYFGDYKKAYMAQRNIIQYKDSLLNSNLITKMAIQSEHLGNDELSRSLRIRELELSERNLQLAAQASETEALRSKQRELLAKEALYHAEHDRAKAENQRTRALLRQEQQWRELSQMRADHSKFVVLLIILSIFVVFLVLVILGIVFYVSNRRKMLKSLRESNERLNEAVVRTAEANRTKSLFLQNMTHEIRTPLNAVLGFSQLLSKSEMPITETEKKEYASYIESNGQLLTSLINDILYVSDIENDNLEMVYAMVDSCQLCKEAISTAQCHLPKGVQLIFSMDMEDDSLIYTDGKRVKQVLANYLSNSCKYTAKGTITLHLTDKLHDGFLTFVVTDTGCGIPKEKRSEIFDLFFQLDRFRQGTGVGLYVCLSIARLMNGRAWCDPDYDDGSRFYFEVPIAMPPEI